MRRLEDAIVAPFMPELRLLVGVVALVLLIVVANATTLLLSRNIVRSREMAIRRALGADRIRLVRQVIVESLLLSVGGCISGIAIAGAAVWLIKAIAVLDVPELFQLAARVQFGTSSVLPRLAEVRVGALVLGFAAGVSVFASVICSVGPALQTLLGDRSSLLTGAEPSILPRLTRNTRRLESVLVIAQLAVATMLLVGAGLLVQSLVNLQNVHPGYDPANVVTFQLVLPAEYDSERKGALATRLCSELRSLPDVSDAGFTNLPPLAGGGLTFGLFVPPGRTLQDMLQERVQPQARAVSPDYLRALGVHCSKGVGSRNAIARVTSCSSHVRRPDAISGTRVPSVRRFVYYPQRFHGRLSASWMTFGRAFPGSNPIRSSSWTLVRRWLQQRTCPNACATPPRLDSSHLRFG